MNQFDLLLPRTLGVLFRTEERFEEVLGTSVLLAVLKYKLFIGRCRVISSVEQFRHLFTFYCSLKNVSKKCISASVLAVLKYRRFPSV